MGLFLRKKSSKASLKGKKDENRAPTPPPQLPPLPDHIRRAEAEAAKQNSANAAAAASSAADPSAKALRRRSRSLWNIGSEAKASAAPTRARRDSLGGGAPSDLASQPWRSHDAWMAFQNPQPAPTVLDELVFPCSNGGSLPGWRGRGGGGLFSTEGMNDTETIRRAATPGGTRCMTPGGTRRPESPAVAAFHHLTPSPSPPAVESLRSDSSSPTPGSLSSGTRETAASGPMPTTPRARAGSLSAAEQPTPQAIPSHAQDYARTPETPGEMLLTPQSTYLASGSTTGTPSPLANAGWSATTPGTPSRPTRRPPPPPVASSTESDDDFQSVPSVPPTPNPYDETEVIDFTRPPPPPQSYNQHASRKRSDSNTRSSPSPVPASPSLRTGQLPESTYHQQPVRTAPSPAPQWTTNADGFYQPSRNAEAAHPSRSGHASVPHAVSTGPSLGSEAYPQPRMVQSPASFVSASLSPNADAGAFQAPLRLPPHPAMAAPMTSPALSTHSTMLPYAQPSGSQLSLAASNTPSRAAPQVPAQDYRPPSRTASGSSHGHGGSHHGHGARPPSRGAASASSHRMTGGTGSRPPSRGASSNGHHSGYHSDAAVPHTQDAIERAVNVWRQKDRKTRAKGDVTQSATSTTTNGGKFSLRKQPHHDAYTATDVFAPAGAYEASGAYNPYDAAEFDPPPASFSPPMRLPQVMSAQGSMPSAAKTMGGRRPSAQAGAGVAGTPRRPSRGAAQAAWI